VPIASGIQPAISASQKEGENQESEAERNESVDGGRRTANRISRPLADEGR